MDISFKTWKRKQENTSEENQRDVVTEESTIDRLIKNNQERHKKNQRKIKALGFSVRALVLVTAVVASLMYSSSAKAVNYIGTGGIFSELTTTFITPLAEDLASQIVGDDQKPNILIRSIADACWNVGVVLTKLLCAGTPDLTPDAIVLNTEDETVFRFSLGDGNPYGIVGANIYAVLRSVSLTIIFVLSCYFIMKLALGAGARQRAQFKELLFTILLMMFLMYFFPFFFKYLLELGGLIKGFVLDKLSLSTVGTDSSPSLAMMVMYTQYKISDPYNIPMALCYIAFLGSSIVFVGEYIGLALTVTLLFGVGPIVFLLSTSDKGLLNKWFMTLLWNALTPIFDTFLLLSIYGITAFTPESSGDFVKGLVVIICMWSLIPARKAVMSMLGGASLGVKSGLGGMAAIAGGMAAGLGKVGKALSGTGEGSLSAIRDDYSNAKAAESLSDSTLSGTTNKGMELSGADKELSTLSGGLAGDYEPKISDLAGAETSKSGDTYMSEQISETSGGDSPSVDSPSGASEGDTFSTVQNVTEGSFSDFTTQSENSTYADNLSSFEGGSNVDIDSQMNSARMSNLENMDASRTRIESLEQSIADKEAALTEVTAGAGSIANDARNWAALGDAYATVEDNSSIKRSSSESDASFAHRQEEANKKVSEAQKEIKTLEGKLGLNQNQDYKGLSTANKQAYVQQQATIASNATKSSEKLRREISQEKAQLQKARTQFAHQQSLESSFAQQDRAMGGRGVRYDSAGQMQTMQSLNAIRKANLSYKNFDTGDNLSLLSQSEKADFYRQRADHATVQKVFEIGAAAAPLAVAPVMGVALSAAGGEESVAAVRAVSQMGAEGLTVIGKTEDAVAASLASKPASKGKVVKERKFTNTGVGAPKAPVSPPPSKPNPMDTVTRMHQMAQAGRDAQNRK